MYIGIIGQWWLPKQKRLFWPLEFHPYMPIKVNQNQRCAIKCMLKVYFGHGLQVDGVELEFWVTYIWVGANSTIIIW